MYKKENFLSIDLSGTEKSNTGIAYFNGNKIITKSVKKNEEILNIVKSNQFKIVGIDAPLTLPKGRESIDKNNGIHFRECDKMLKKRGYKFFPITLGGMRKLTKRGMMLKKMIMKAGKEVYEIFPGASLDALGLKRKDLGVVKELLKELGYKEDIKNVDESDAAVGLITLKFLFEGKSELLKGGDGCIVVIKKNTLKLK